MIGRGGQVLFKDIPGILHVKVIAPTAIRIERIQNRYNYDHRMAEQTVRHTDHDRSGFHKFFFHTNILYEGKIPVRFLEVIAVSGVVSIRGSVITGEDIERCEAVVRKVPGVKDVVNELYYTPIQPIAPVQRP